jgi:hypothetical protein
VLDLAGYQHGLELGRQISRPVRYVQIAQRQHQHHLLILLLLLLLPRRARLSSFTQKHKNAETHQKHKRTQARALEHQKNTRSQFHILCSLVPRVIRYQRRASSQLFFPRSPQLLAFGKSMFTL